MLKEEFSLFLSIIIISQCLIHIVENHTCTYRLPKIAELINEIKIEALPPNFGAIRAANPNLRIYFDYQSSFTSSPHASSLKEKILEPARQQLQRLIYPKSATNGILRIDRACINGVYRIANGNKGCAYGCTTTTCLNVVIPDVYLKQCITVNRSGFVTYSNVQGAGVPNVDIVLLITYLPCLSSAIAYAGSCFTESTLDRPILGVINLCSDYITSTTKIKENINVMMHEIIHALGFSVDKYAFYRNDDGTPIVPRNQFGWPSLGLNSDNNYYMWNDQIIKQITRNRASIYSNYTKTFYGFVLPNVLSAARNHFNCPNLAAVDLEDFGTLGSAMSHFDEYFLFNELMTPQTNNGMDTLSNISLALLQDTGWYTVDYAGARNLDYGYQKGCTLPEQGCYTYMKSQIATSSTLDPFLNKIPRYGKTISCSKFKDYFGYSNIMQMSSVPKINRYFTSLEGVSQNMVQYYSGPSPYNEFCPGYEVKTDPSSICNNELNNNVLNPFNIVPSYFGPDSMCFVNDMYVPYPNTFYGASCQKYSMNSSQMTIHIGNQSFKCTSSNSSFNYTLADGKVIIISCPATISIKNKSPIEIKNKSQIEAQTKSSIKILNRFSKEIFIILSILTAIDCHY